MSSPIVDAACRDPLRRIGELAAAACRLMLEVAWSEDGSPEEQHRVVAALVVVGSDLTDEWRRHGRLATHRLQATGGRGIATVCDGASRAGRLFRTQGFGVHAVVHMIRLRPESELLDLLDRVTDEARTLAGDAVFSNGTRRTWRHLDSVDQKLVRKLHEQHEAISGTTLIVAAGLPENSHTKRRIRELWKEGTFAREGNREAGKLSVRSLPVGFAQQ